MSVWYGHRNSFSSQDFFFIADCTGRACEGNRNVVGTKESLLATVVMIS